MASRGFFEELKRRKVVRVATVYLAAGLGVIYAADTILPRLGLPDWSVTLVIVLVGLGLPIAIALAWAFDITPEGVVRAPTPERPSHESRGATRAGVEAPRSSPGVATASGGVVEIDRGTTGRPGIVVLPFDDLSPDADNVHFSDGLTEEIIADLSGIKALRVISRTSAMQLRNTDKDVPTIGRELGVRYVIEGSVRKASASLRITAQLIDAATDEHLWADKYDGTVDEVFDLQERVAREIVRALDVTLSSEEDRRLSEHPIRDVRAFELYLRARRILRRYSTEGVSELLEQAIAIEGKTPPLRALLAWAKVNEVRSGRNRDMRPLDEAEREAHDLLEDAPDASYGHALLGYIAHERGDQPLAVRHFEASLQIEPNDADALFYLGIANNAADQTASAWEASARLLASDPLAPLAHLLRAIIPWFDDGPAAAGVESMERSLALDPGNLIVHWSAGYMFALLGRMSDAATHGEWLRENGAGLPYTGQLLSLIEAIEGRPETALEILATVDAGPLDAHHSFHLGESFAMAGRPDRALELVERAVDGGFYPYRYYAEYCPFMESLRGSVEYDRILEKARRRVDEFSTD